MTLKIGFIGMGIMGVPMARNLLKAGHALTVYNRSTEKCAPVAAAGAVVAASPLELTKASDVVIVMLTGPEAIDDLLFGEASAAEALDGKIVVNMSTVSPAYSRELAANLDALGAAFVDAPVSGSKKPAEEGTLVILAGGEEKTISQVEPILLAMGKKVVRCGRAPNGSMMKMSINLLLGAMCEGLAEMIAFGEKGGLDRETMLNVVMAGPLKNGMFELKAPMFEKDEFPAQFPAKHMAKDLKFVVDTAYETGATAPAAHVLLQLYSKVVAMGLGDQDFAAVFKTLQ